MIVHLIQKIISLVKKKLRSLKERAESFPIKSWQVALGSNRSGACHCGMMLYLHQHVHLREPADMAFMGFSAVTGVRRFGVYLKLGHTFLSYKFLFARQ